MFEILGRRIAAALAIAAAAAHVVRAQTAAEYAKRVDSLTAVWHAAVAEQARADSERVRRLPADTVRVGPLIILTEADLVELAKATAAIVAPELYRAYGAWANRMQTHPILLRRRTPDAKTSGSQSPLVSGVAGPGGQLLMPSASIASVDALKAAWLRTAEELLSEDLDPEVRDWLASPLTTEPATARTLSKGRSDLVLARSRVAHACALGNHEACMQALGLVSVDDPSFTLFDARQRVELIEWYSFALQRRDPAAYARCVQGGNAATCDSLIRSIPPDVVPKPVPPAVRSNFVRYALLLGGDGAFDRLANTKGPIADRIASAARMPVDSVVSRWQANVMASQAASTAIDATTAVSSLFWACLCGALALRSSRWR